MIQRRMTEWGVSVFGPAYATDTIERCRRFIEEAIELVQATGEMSEDDVRTLASYVYRRPPGVPVQEVGGALLTLGALSECLKVDMFAAAESELADLRTPARIASVVAKTRERGANELGAWIAKATNDLLDREFDFIDKMNGAEEPVANPATADDAHNRHSGSVRCLTNIEVEALG